MPFPRAAVRWEWARQARRPGQEMARAMARRKRRSSAPSTTRSARPASKEFSSLLFGGGQGCKALQLQGAGRRGPRLPFFLLAWVNGRARSAGPAMVSRPPDAGDDVRHAAVVRLERQLGDDRLGRALRGLCPLPVPLRLGVYGRRRGSRDRDAERARESHREAPAARLRHRARAIPDVFLPEWP